MFCCQVVLRLYSGPVSELRGGQRGAAGFTATFEIVAATRRGGSAKKGDPFARRTPRWPLATLAAQSALAIPTRPRGHGAGGRCRNTVPGQLKTQRPNRSA